MKSLKNIFAIILLTSTVAFISCTKKSSSSDTEKPVITIAEPTANDTLTYSIDPEIHIEFTATDNNALHSLLVELKDDNNTILQSSSPDVLNLKTYSFHTHFIPSAFTVVKKYTIKIEAKDHAENTLLKELSVYMKP